MSWFVTVRHPPPAQEGICYGRADVAAEFSSAQVDSLLARMGKLLPVAGPERVVSSPARRCHRLAVELSSRLDLPLEVDARLCELAFGQWEGRSWRELELDPSFRAWMSNWKSAAPPGGESLGELHSRVGEWLEALAEHGVPSLVLTHAGVLRSLRVRVAGWTWERAFEEPVPHLVPEVWKLAEQGPRPGWPVHGLASPALSTATHAASPLAAPVDSPPDREPDRARPRQD